MITYKVLISTKADSDEAGIHKYILEKFGEIYADNFRKKLIELFKLLAKQPFLGRPAKDDAVLRVFIFNRQNKIVYKVTESEIIILRLLHTKTNLASKF